MNSPNSMQLVSMNSTLKRMLECHSFYYPHFTHEATEPEKLLELARAWGWEAARSLAGWSVLSALSNVASC